MSVKRLEYDITIRRRWRDRGLCGKERGEGDGLLLLLLLSLRLGGSVEVRGGVPWDQGETLFDQPSRFARPCWPGRGAEVRARLARLRHYRNT